MSDAPAMLPNLGANDDLPQRDSTKIAKGEAEQLPTRDVQQHDQPLPNVCGDHDVFGQHYHHTGDWRQHFSDSSYFERYSEEVLPPRDPVQKAPQSASEVGTQEDDHILYISRQSDSEQQDTIGEMLNGAEELATKSHMCVYEKSKISQSTGDSGQSQSNEQDWTTVAFGGQVETPKTIVVIDVDEENADEFLSQKNSQAEGRPPPANPPKTAVLNRSTKANGQDEPRPATLEASHLHQTWHAETQGRESHTSGLGLDSLKRRPFAHVDPINGKIKASDECDGFYEDFSFSDPVKAIHKLDQGAPDADVEPRRLARIATTDINRFFLKSIYKGISDVQKAVVDDREQVHQSREQRRNAPARINGWQRFRKKYREMLAETLGVTIMTVLGVGINAQGWVMKMEYGNVAEIPVFLLTQFGRGFAVMSGYYCSGNVSGSHINPATTISMAIFRRSPWTHIPFYILSQFLGCLIASFLVRRYYYPSFLYYTELSAWTDISSINSTARIFATFPANGVNNGFACFAEFLGTAIMVIIIFVTADMSNLPAERSAPLIVALVTMTIGFSFGYTGWAFNSLRDFAGRIVFVRHVRMGSQIWTCHEFYFWVPIVGPLLGASFGAFVYDALVFTGPSLVNCVRMEHEREMQREPSRRDTILSIKRKVSLTDAAEGL